MAYFTSATTATKPTLFNRFNAAVANMGTRYKQHRLYRETFEGLNALGNRELADLGLSRSELRRVAWDAAYK